MARKRTLQELREYRHKVALLKKKGIISSSIDARSVKPSSNLSRIINRNEAIIKGEATTFKVKPKEAKKLKDVGFKVVKAKGQKARVIVNKNTFVRKGKVYEHATLGRTGRQIIDHPLGVQWEQTVRKVFNELQPGDLIGFAIDVEWKPTGEIIRGNSYSMYQTAEALIHDLSGYKSFQGGLVSRLTVFRLSKEEQGKYIADGMIRREERFGRRKRAA